jgi:TatD DNase family protein
MIAGRSGTDDTCLADSHCHLDFDEFAPDLDTTVQRAAAAGIDALVTISIRVREFGRVRAVIERYDNARQGR